MQREDGKDPGFIVDHATKFTLSSFMIAADSFKYAPPKPESYILLSPIE